MFWTVFLVILALCVALLLFGVLLYNGLVTARQRVAEAFSGIDVQLKRRSNLVPNLVETVKGYAAHEKEALDRVTSLRSRAAAAEDSALADRASIEGQLGAAIGRLFAVSEAYPDLKASQNFQDLHQSLDEIERDLQHARRYYNGSVRDLNVKIESVPSNIVANQFGFQRAEFFELDTPADRDVPKVAF